MGWENGGKHQVNEGKIHRVKIKEYNNTRTTQSSRTAPRLVAVGGRAGTNELLEFDST